MHIQSSASPARARGRVGGRPKALNEDQIRQIRAMHKDISIPIDQIMKTFKISRNTLYKYLKGK